ncbi:hypothetical protein CKO41_10140 [Thiococcus pfennigii]|nr:hypothetical protein [Thiococcus pfennigii]
MNPHLTLLALAVGLALSAPASARPSCAPGTGAESGGYGPPPCYQPCPPWNCAHPAMAPRGSWEGGWGAPHGEPACGPAKRGTPPAVGATDDGRRPYRHGAWDNRGGYPGGDPDKAAAIRLERMAARLTLSEDQKSEVAAILAEARAEREAQRQATRERIAALLTPEQLERLDQRGRPTPPPQPAQPQPQPQPGPTPEGASPAPGQGPDQDADA